MANLTELFARGHDIGARQRGQALEEKFRDTQREKILSDLALRNRKASPKFGEAFGRVTDPDVPLTDLQADLSELYVDLPSFREALRTRNDRIMFRRRLAHDEEKAKVDRELAQLQLEAAKQRNENIETSGGRQLGLRDIQDRLRIRNPELSEEDIQKRTAGLNPDIQVTESEFDNLLPTQKTATPINVATARKAIRGYAKDQIAALRPSAFKSDGSFKDEGLRSKWLQASNEALEEHSGATVIDFSRVNELLEENGVLSSEERGRLDKFLAAAKGTASAVVGGAKRVVAGVPGGGEDDGGVGTPAPSDIVPAQEEPVQPAVKPEEVIENDFNKLNSQIQDETELGQEMLRLLAERGMLDEKTRNEVLRFVRTERNREEVKSLVKKIGGLFSGGTGEPSAAPRPDTKAPRRQ